jgi:tetratricopeptide (TPR) repeat protein
MTKKKKMRKANVEMPGLDDLELPADAPPEMLELLALMQKGMEDPESLTEKELESFQGLVRSMSEEADSMIPPEDRAEAQAKAARAWMLLQAGEYEQAGEMAEEALDLNPQEPVAEFILAMMVTESEQEAFEAMCAINLQCELELEKNPDPQREELLREVYKTSAFHAAGAAIQAGHFESAIEPLIPLYKDENEDQAGPASITIVALIGIGDASRALEIIHELDPEDPIRLWSKVMALIANGDREAAADAFAAAHAQAPEVLEMLKNPPDEESLLREMATQSEIAQTVWYLRPLYKHRKKIAKGLNKLARS